VKQIVDILVKYYTPVMFLISYQVFIFTPEAYGANPSNFIILCASLAGILLVAILLLDYLKKNAAYRAAFYIWLILESFWESYYIIDSHSVTFTSGLQLFVGSYLIYRFFGSSSNRRQKLLLSATAGIVVLLCSLYSFIQIEDPYLNDQDIWYEFSGIIFFLLPLIYLLMKSSNELIEHETSEKEKSNSLLELNNKVMTLIGHNIRTPLTNLKLQIDIARKQEPNEKRFIEINKSIEKLIEITESTMSSSQPLDRSDSTIDFIKQIKTIYGDKLDIIVDDEVYFHSSDHLGILFLCLQNLIDNALYWSNKSKPILKLNIANQGLLIHVKDFGKGMTYSTFSNYGSKNIAGLNPQGKSIGMYYSIQLVNKAGFDFLVKTKEKSGTEVVIVKQGLNQDDAFFDEKNFLYKTYTSDHKEEPRIVDQQG